jgi:hypothetical protein
MIRAIGKEEEINGGDSEVDSDEDPESEEVGRNDVENE